MKRAAGAVGGSVEYRKLRDAWYRRLAESGFVDVELPDGRLRDHSAQYYAEGLDKHVRTARAEYYDAAGEYLWATDWAGREGERRIWELHAEGQSVREIGARLGISKDHAQRCVTFHRGMCIIQRQAANRAKAQETNATPGL